MLSDKQSYYAHVAMVALSIVIGTVTFGDYFDPKTSKLIFQVLTVLYGVIGFIANGVMPPNSKAAPLPVVPPAVKALLLAALLPFALLLVGGAADAQNLKRKPVAAPVVEATPVPRAAPQAKQITKAQAQANPLNVLQTFTVGDLQAALADAQAQTPADLASINCYTALLPLVQSGVQNPLPTGLGAFQLLQKARDAKALLANIQSPNGPLAALNIACAPLVLDAQNVLIQLGIVGGTVAASGGLVLPAFLPGLLPFPIP